MATAFQKTFTARELLAFAKDTDADPETFEIVQADFVEAHDLTPGASVNDLVTVATRYLGYQD